jgi:hypothetical protein
LWSRHWWSVELRDPSERIRIAALKARLDSIKDCIER